MKKPSGLAGFALLWKIPASANEGPRMKMMRLRRPACVAMIAALGFLLAPQATRAAEHPDLFRLTSPDFADDGFLTAANAGQGKSPRGPWACGGQDVSPALAWSHAPHGTKSFAVIMDDPDAASGRGGTHWIAYGIAPGVSALPRNAGDGSTNLLVGGSNGTTSVYHGPCAEPNAKTHHFLWMVFALDLAPGALPANLTQAQFMKRIKGHNLSEASLVSRYQPHSP
jgi:Raf kinase inhibitor-like YbhB/YbcL family protein